MLNKKKLFAFSLFSILFLVGVFTRIFIDDLPSFASNVTGTGDKNIAQLKKCEKKPYDEIQFDHSERSSCYKLTVAGMVRDEGLGITINTLKTYMQSDEGKFLDGRRCHDLGHGIGIEAVKKGVPSKEILTECADWCVGGCLNGAAHVYVLTDHQPDELVSFCNVDGVGENLKRMCYHGLGHGYMETNSADITKTMNFCEQIPSEMGQYECGHAAVMDYALLYTAPVRTIPEDIVGFCDSKKKVFQPSCYEFVGFLAYSRTVDTKDSFVACKKIPAEFKENCQERIGEAYFSILGRDPEKIVKGCEIGTGEELDRCMEGAVRSSIYGADSSFGGLGAKFCSLLQNKTSRIICFEFLGGEIEAVHGQERRTETCNQLFGEDKKNCEKIRQERDMTIK